MRAWQIHRKGEPSDVLRLDEIASPTPNSGEVLVGIKAAAVSFADLLLCRGKYQEQPPPPFTPGLEGSGQILAVGAGVDLAIGTRVIVSPLLPGSCLAEEVVCPAQFVFEIPPEVDFVVAAALHVSYVTALITLRRCGKLRRGETLLVHAGSGSLGSATIQVGRVLGAEILATAGGPEKVEICRSLGARAAIDYLNEDLISRVLAETGGRGVDMVYDVVGGDVFDQSRRCVAFEGRILIVGFTSGRIPSIPANHLLLKNYSVVGAPAGLYRMTMPQYWRECHAEVMEMYLRRQIDPLIGLVHDFTELPAALEQIAQRKTIGRHIVRL